MEIVNPPCGLQHRPGGDGGVSAHPSQLPEWEKAGKVHDWRNHVPDAVQMAWDTFTDDQKLLLYKWADDLASAEEWE